MGGRWGLDFPLIGFKPDPIIVCRDSQGGDAIQQLVQGRDMCGTHLFGIFEADTNALFGDRRRRLWLNGRAGAYGETAELESLSRG